MEEIRAFVLGKELDRLIRIYCQVLVDENPWYDVVEKLDIFIWRLRTYFGIERLLAAKRTED